MPVPCSSVNSGGVFHNGYLVVFTKTYIQSFNLTSSTWDEAKVHDIKADKINIVSQPSDKVMVIFSYQKEIGMKIYDFSSKLSSSVCDVTDHPLENCLAPHYVFGSQD